MAQIKGRFGREDFPILFEDGRLRVFRNSSDEIFVEDVRSGAQMRINQYPDHDGGLQFTTDQLVEPTRVHGTIGWKITHRHALPTPKR